MLKNHFKSAIRNLNKSKGFSAINVIGLAIGLATCLLIILYVSDELSYDHYNKKIDRIYRIDADLQFGGHHFIPAASPEPFRSALKREFPEREQYVRIRYHGGFLVKKGNQNIHEDKADPTQFSIFNLPMAERDPKTAFVNPNLIVIAESVAKNYFNSTIVVGKPLTVNDTYCGNAKPGFIASLTTNDYASALKKIRATWTKLNPTVPFEYSFLDQDFQRSYEKEQLTSGLVSCFTVIAIIIACLGLFGLSAFAAEQRIKEIGIRKVLGASVSQITLLLSKEFIGLVATAVIIASPLAWWGMNRWLQSFAYKIVISWWMFVAAGCGAICIALLTISFQGIKAAVANPVESLRSE